MLRISAYVAIGFALFLSIGEAVRNWGDWQWWPFWVVDYVAATFLLIGGLSALRMGRRSLLASAWAFVAAMSYMSFFTHIDWMRKNHAKAYGPDGALTEQSLTAIIGAMTAIAVIGLLFALFGRGRD